ncbi:MAG TPA: FUSC family protein, partial [Ktedonobacteraceae bacterium]|nr:FUSC family protein [Ktedonobacteraceae bacterium]
LTSFGDVGTSFRTQAWSLGMTAVGGALMTALGRLIGGPWWVEIVEIFLVVFISKLLSVYGRVAAAMGLLLTIPFVISLANRGGPATTLPAVGGFLLGGAVLMLFALLFAWLPSHRSTPRNEARRNRPQPRLTTLTAQLTLTSPLLRLSLLRAVGAAVAAGSGWIWGGSPFYWAALTVIICTRQDQKASLMMALQNVIATFLGALLAAVLIASVQNTLVVGLIVMAITFQAFTVKELNYLLYLFFFTILILLLISIATSGQSLAVWRVVTILFGAGIVLVITFLAQMPFFERKVVSP